MDRRPQINEDKTKYVICSRNRKLTINLTRDTFELAERQIFPYLGVLLNRENKIENVIRDIMTKCVINHTTNTS